MNKINKKESLVRETEELKKSVASEILNQEDLNIDEILCYEIKEENEEEDE